MLNIPQVAAKGMATGFALATSVLVPVTLILASKIEADVGNDDPDVYAGQTYDIKAFKYQTREQRLAEDAAMTSSFLIKTKDLNILGFTDEGISDGDKIEDGAFTWTIYRADPDPSGAAWTVQARR